MDVAPFILFFALIGSISTAFSMYKQLDAKKIIAYSSVVHMNIAVFGYFCGSQLGIQGAMFFSFSHGLISAGLFCAFGYLHDKIKTRNIMEISGLWVYMPRWSFFVFILLMANAGLPGTVGFIAEFSLICGLFEHFPFMAVLMLVPTALAAFRNYLLFTQICMGVPSTYFGEYFLKRKNISNNFKNKFNKNNFNSNKEFPIIHKNTKEESVNIFIIKNWDLQFTGEGVTICFITFFSVYTGLCPQYFVNLVE